MSINTVAENPIHNPSLFEADFVSGFEPNFINSWMSKAAIPPVLRERVMDNIQVTQQFHRTIAILLGELSARAKTDPNDWQHYRYKDDPVEVTRAYSPAYSVPHSDGNPSHSNRLSIVTSLSSGDKERRGTARVERLTFNGNGRSAYQGPELVWGLGVKRHDPSFSQLGVSMHILRPLRLRTHEDIIHSDKPGDMPYVPKLVTPESAESGSQYWWYGVRSVIAAHSVLLPPQE